MNAVLARRGGMWVGWPGESTGIGNPKREEIIDRWRTEDGLVPVELPPEIADHFYTGYANQTLWPLFHHFPSRLTFDPQGWAAYRDANMLFRDAAVPQVCPGDLLWVHDYHLMLLPRLLRESLPGAAIGFFLHIPFPSSEVFRVLPEREDLLAGLLGADLVAFQTYSHLQNFRSSLRRVLGIESRLDEVEVGGRTVRLEALPIGIATEEFTKPLILPEGIRRVQELQERYRGRQVLLAVDRMDYTKGIPERLRTYRRLLDRRPELRGKVALLQVAVPSRERIFAYETLRRQVNELVGEINGQFATPNWTPVVYIQRNIARAELAALYAIADVAWVSPLRDGMNLVAKEYVTCKTDLDGVLVLSEFAGAAEEMGEAIIVNPNDEERTANAIEMALLLPSEERRRRMMALQNRVRRNNAFAWSEEFLTVLQNAAAHPSGSPAKRPPLNAAAAMEAYRDAAKRLFLLDYDGTLVGYSDRPDDAVPSSDLLQTLESLASAEKNAILIISGRKRDDLQRWFGSVRNLWLAAEHGALMRRPNSEPWEYLGPEQSPRHWLERVRPVLKHFVDRTPGSFIEEKEFAVVWHYRMSEARFGEWLAHELVAMLDDMLADTELRAIRGRKIVEVRPGWLHKGAIAKRFTALCGPAQFQFAAGDDRTDEDMFEALNGDTWTVHVGAGRSRAHFGLAGPHEVIEVLRQMAGIDSGAGR